MKRYRKEKLGSLIKGIVAESVQQRLNDPRVSPLTTVTRVEMSSDLQFAKIFLSVPGDAAVERRTLAAVKHAGGFLQRHVAHALSVRVCPALTFEIDEQAKKVRHLMGLLEKNRLEAPDRIETENAAEAPDVADEVECEDRRDDDGRSPDL